MSLHALSGRHRDPRSRVVPTGVPRLRVVRSDCAPRPRWSVLYVSLVVIALGSLVAFTMARSSTAELLVDVLMGGALIGVMAVWVRANRIGLACANQTPGSARPAVRRVIRSRRPQPAEVDERHERDERGVVETSRRGPVVRLDPDDAVILPYDFS
jgi:hypothetical protein